MDLILTHEIAEFDAIAALVAAHKLVPSARPLLPNKVNRNVRRFLTIYGQELPLLKAADLPRGSVSHVLLVDTQHVQTVRGMDDTTTVRVIDHHPIQDELDATWDVTVDEVGATTTLMCEALQESQVVLTRVEATLLLLGIYEDTGSLLYGATTPRDVRAAAWLLEQGASLDVVHEFLHHPLSDDQRAVYERLIEDAESHDVAGFSVVVACAEAPELVAEVSSLAHTLRDLFNPAALVMLVDLGSHVQMVARSTVDAIDVGHLARVFGGGGHGRASAAILRDMTVSESRAAVLRALPGAIQDSVTVAQLMSHGVLTLPPDTRADEAAEFVRRYGYEGYPVVDNGQLVGLLKRRAVDRAIDHGLQGVRVRELMDAGAYTVSPDDSMARVQEVMMSSEWGQVPVVDEAGRILGVVTRTDLIKQWAATSPEGSARPSPDDIVRKLEDALPPPLMALVRYTGQVAQEMGLSLYVVGGFVRDLLLDQPNTDVDFVVEGDAIALVKGLSAQLGGDTRSHSRFGTGKWLLSDVVWQRLGEQANRPLPGTLARNGDLPRTIDFVSARTEFYAHPTALPEVERSSIKLDLHRRDFTINTLAMQLDRANEGRLLDFWGGLRDLERQAIRVLHSLSFVDDPTRILRAARLEQRLEFRIEPRTEELIKLALPMLEKLSGDRVRHEFELIFAEQRPEDVLVRLAGIGGLATLHPALRADDWLRSAYAAQRWAVAQPLWPELASLPNLEVPYFALLTRHLDDEELRHVCKRIKVQRKTVEDLSAARDLLELMPFLGEPQRPSALDAALRPFNDRVLLVGWAAAPSAPTRQQIAHYARVLRHVHPLHDGEALKELGLQPGPQFGAILRALRAACLDGRVRDEAGERTLIDDLLKSHETE
jgi:tRNA nucleotidyltransferase (CCA-adding enzyme)